MQKQHIATMCCFYWQYVIIISIDYMIIKIERYKVDYMNWTKKQAREFLVNYHMINSSNLYTIKDVFNRIKSIQYDPLNVVGTNPELVLQSRVHNFKKEMLYDALYKERYLIDGWDKQMCIFRTKEFPQLDRKSVV